MGYVEQVEHVATGKLVPVYRYKLARVEMSYYLTDEVSCTIVVECVSANNYQHEAVQSPHPELHPAWHSDLPFYRTDLVRGFLINLESHHPFNEVEVLKNAIKEHKILFALLYQFEVSLDDYTGDNDEYDSTIEEDSNNGMNLTATAFGKALLIITNVIALAEYYDLMPAVSAGITELLRGLPGFWEDVARSPDCYISIANKIRSAELFADATRHYVGQDLNGGQVTNGWSYLFLCAALTRTEAAASILPLRENLDSRINKLLESLRRDCLTTYQAHADRSRNKQGPIVPATWLTSEFLPNSIPSKCHFLAGCIFREWLDHQLVGESFWSHVKYSTTSPKDGKVEAG